MNEPSPQEHPGNNADPGLLAIHAASLPCQTFVRNVLKAHLPAILYIERHSPLISFFFFPPDLLSSKYNRLKPTARDLAWTSHSRERLSAHSIPEWLGGAHREDDG